MVRKLAGLGYAITGYNSMMTSTRQIIKVFTKRSLHDQQSDLLYWQAQPMQARIAALEEMRQEFHQWQNNAQPGFQRVYTIVKRPAS